VLADDRAVVRTGLRPLLDDEPMHRSRPWFGLEGLIGWIAHPA
jgi:hypothetical protein